MIDINNIVNTAIAQEINKAITNYVDAYMADVQQEHRRQIEALKAQIACMEVDLTRLKEQRADSPATGAGMVLEKEAVLGLLYNSAGVRQAVYEIAYEAGQAVLNEHAEAYDHDSYDNAASAIEDANLDSLPDFDDYVKNDDLPDFDDFVKCDDLEDAIRDAISIDDYVKEDQMCDVIEEKINDLVDVDTLVTKDDVLEAVRTEVRNTIENHLSVSLRLD